MKKIHRPAKFINILLASAILIFSCKDENTLENLNQRNLQASQDYLLIEKTIVDIEREIEHAFISTQTTKDLPNYISLNNDTSNQDTLIINFGDENFLHLGHIKRGEINIIYNQFLYNSGAIINTTFTDFYINNNLVQGTITLENNGFNENSNLEFKLSVNNLSLNTENGIINLTGEYSKELKNDISAKNISFEERSAFFGAQRIGGAIFNTKIDRSHPINFGQTNTTMPIFRNSTIFIEKDKESYNNPILYTDNPLLSGYISEENIDLLKSTSPIKINKIGKGKVIYLTDNTNFRAFWYGTNKILMNAIFFGNIM